MAPEPLTLHVPDEVLDDVQARLERVRWSDEVADAGWFGSFSNAKVPATG